MTESNLLHSVARLFNIQINLYDGFGHLMQPPPEAILRVLNILGAPVERMDDLAGALRQRRQFLMQRGDGSSGGRLGWRSLTAQGSLADPTCGR